MHVWYLFLYYNILIAIVYKLNLYFYFTFETLFMKLFAIQFKKFTDTLCYAPFTIYYIIL
jgi:hypothetical protein